MRALVLCVLCVLAMGACGGESINPAAPLESCCKQNSAQCTINPPPYGSKRPVWCRTCKCLTCDMDQVTHTTCKTREGVLCGGESRRVGDWHEVVEHEPCP